MTNIVKSGFIDCLKTNGAQVFIIGGSVRNLFYNKIHKTKLKYKDVDFVIRLLSEQKIIELLKDFGIVKEVGKSFGVIKFKEFGKNEEYDIALPRQEISTGHKHTDFKVNVDCDLELESDCERRDATINAIALEIFTDSDLDNLELLIEDKNKIFDYFGGINDIKDKLWKAICNPDTRFKEDNLRMLRAIRQSAELDLNIEDKTKESINRNYKLLDQIIKDSPVRVANELVRLIASDKAYKMVEYLFESNISSICDITTNTSMLFNDLSEYDIKIRMALLLYAHTNKNIRIWSNKYQLSAAPNYSCKNVDFLDCCNCYYENVRLLNNKYDMRKFIQLLEDNYKNKRIEYAKSLIKYFEIIERKQDTKLILYEENKEIILTVNNVKIDGNRLIKNGIIGNKIKELKTKLFNMITMDEIVNDPDIIIDYLLREKILKI
jgi:tRNA nucleotidyltransferase (CCA-adding enzyme)